MKQIVMIFFAALLLVACKNSAGSNETAMQPVGPTFMEDSAYLFCQKQCEFGPRVMNYKAHDFCGDWIAKKFGQYGLEVTKQSTVVKGYDGTPLNCTNIIASYQPEKADRILICAHWDSRPWADNDPDEENWHKPVMAANDGASGVAVMLELARLLNITSDSIAQTLPGIDFICFDAEDWGTPQWSEAEDASDTWALGAQYWAANPHCEGYKARYGILLDMVGGQGARFFRERYSQHYAQNVVSRVWQAASVVGYGSYFPPQDGGGITDDHVPVNQVAGIPCIDIIPYYPDCEESSFGPTWHTVNDDMEHIDKNTLKAVGQTLVQVIFSE